MLILHDDQSSAIIQPGTRLRRPQWGKYKAKKRRRKGEKTSSPFPPSYSTAPIFVAVLPCFLSFSPLQSLVQGYSYNDERHRPEIHNLESFPKGGLFGILIQTLGTVIYINPAQSLGVLGLRSILDSTVSCDVTERYTPSQNLPLFADTSTDTSILSASSFSKMELQKLVKCDQG